MIGTVNTISSFHYLDTDPCYPNPCQHNGNCLNDGRNAFKCNCTQGFKGYKCDSKLFVYIISLLRFGVPQGSVLDPINVLLHSNSITVVVNKGRFCNTIASVALVHTSIQSD